MKQQFQPARESAARNHVAVPCMKTQEATGVFAGGIALARKTGNRTGSTAEYPLDSNRKEEEEMYYNANGEKVSRARWKEMYNAFKNRQELVKAGLTSRRDLMRLGLLTAGGMLIAKKGLSSRAWAGTWGSGRCYSGSSGCGTCASPTTRPWVMNLPIPPVKQPIALSALTGTGADHRAEYRD